GSLFLFDRMVLRYFRKDGHNWRKKKHGKTVKEAHEKLKVGRVDVLHCYYAHDSENPNLHHVVIYLTVGTLCAQDRNQVCRCVCQLAIPLTVLLVVLLASLSHDLARHAAGSYGYDPFGLSKKPEDFAKLWHPTSLNFMQNVVNGNQSL
ncbi:hypothetical protein S83_028920, partial [Arachis hypogaea]